MSDLATARYMSLKSFKRDGSSVATPVWFAPHSSRLYVFSAADAGKVKRIRNNGTVEIAPCGIYGALLGSWQPARARLLTETGDCEAAHRALRSRYGWQMKLLDFGAALTGRNRRRAWLEIVPEKSS